MLVAFFSTILGSCFNYLLVSVYLFNISIHLKEKSSYKKSIKNPVARLTSPRDCTCLKCCLKTLSKYDLNLRDWSETTEYLESETSTQVMVKVV